MASIRRRNGKYQVQIRLGSYIRSQSFHKLNDAKSWARREEELAQQRRFLGGLIGGNSWMVVPENLENLSPKERCYFHIHMYGDGEISIYFARKDKSGRWQKDDIFCFSRYRFER